MEKWADDVRIKLAELMRVDEEYQVLLQKCGEREKEYLRVMRKLTDDEQMCIDEYILLCEEMQYRMTQLAYWCGVLDGRSGS